LRVGHYVMGRFVCVSKYIHIHREKSPQGYQLDRNDFLEISYVGA
jgi:hypothetical protein